MLVRPLVLYVDTDPGRTYVICGLELRTCYGRNACPITLPVGAVNKPSRPDCRLFSQFSAQPHGLELQAPYERIDSVVKQGILMWKRGLKHRGE
jgi:hypothetical protein